MRPPGLLLVELSASAEEYLLGQPIRMTLRVTNDGDKTLRFRRVDIDCGEAPLLHLSTDGATFAKLETGTGRAYSREYRQEVLAPGASAEYHFRVLYSWCSHNKLAIPEPGRYWLRMDFPYLENFPYLEKGKPLPRNINVPSNDVEIRITEPTGVDAAMFQTLRQEPFLMLLDMHLEQRPATIRTALGLLREHPTSGYHADLKASLEAYYRGVSTSGMTSVNADPQWKAVLEELRQYLGIPRPEDLPFPEDKRLGAKFTFAFQDGASIRDVVTQASQLTKVPLSVTPPNADLMMYGAYQDEELRQFMRNLGKYDRHWVPDGDGYKLVPKPPEKAKSP